MDYYKPGRFKPRYRWRYGIGEWISVCRPNGSWPWTLDGSKRT